jgi:hypothetical protein
MLVTRSCDVGGSRIIEEGAEAAIVVHADIALEVLERPLFISPVVGSMVVGWFKLLVLWRFHASIVARQGEGAVKCTFIIAYHRLVDVTDRLVQVRAYERPAKVPGARSSSHVHIAAQN